MSFIKENTFAESCYNQNSIQELIDGLTQDADQSDMIEWGLTEDQWRDQIKVALAEMLADSGEALGCVAEWANTNLDSVTIDSDGDIHDGRAWLSNDRLAEFYGWFASM